jgi:hypothetical protein
VSADVDGDGGARTAAAAGREGGNASLGGVYAWGSNYHGQLGNGFFTCWDYADEELQESSSSPDPELAELGLRPKSHRAGAKRDALSSWVSEIKQLEGARIFLDGDAQEGVGGGGLKGGDLRWPVEGPAGGRGEDVAGTAGIDWQERGGWQDLLEPGLCVRNDALWSPVIDVAAGYQHSLALLANGSVLAWGSNQAGQLGVPFKPGGGGDIWLHPDNTMPFRPSPSMVPGLPGPVVSISAGFAHSAAVLADGRIFTWGADFDGQLGHGGIHPCTPGEGGNSITLPGDHVPREVRVSPEGGNEGGGGGGGGGAVAVSVGSSHSLALVKADAFGRYPQKSGNLTGEVKDWWPCLRDLLEEVDDEYRGGGLQGEGALTADEILETHMRGLRMEEPVYRLNWTDDMLSRVARCDMSAQPLRAADPLFLFHTTRSYFTNDASTQLCEILPNVYPVVVQNEEWPSLKHIEWQWRNVTREEALKANMPYPQQYRDGYGASGPSPEESEALLQEARQIYFRHGGADMAPNSPEEKSARAETRALLDAFDQSLCVRNAENAGDDARRLLALGEFEEARKWARKQRIALRYLVDLQGDPQVVEKGRVEVEETMLAIDRAEDEHNLRKLGEHTALMDALYETREGAVFNSTDQSWYRPDPASRPIDTLALADLPFGYIEVELPVGEGVQDLKRRLCRMLREPAEAVALYYNGTLLESDPPPGIAPLRMMEGGRVWGKWGGTWQERDLEAEKEADNRRFNVLSRSDKKWLRRECEEIEREEKEEREEREEREQTEREEKDQIKPSGGGDGGGGGREGGGGGGGGGVGAPPTRVGTDEEDEEEIKGRMTNKWMQGLHGWFKNEDEELEVVSKRLTETTN